MCRPTPPCHAGCMTSPQPTDSPRISPWSLRALAVHGPLALFASGILRWVDGLAGQPGGGVLRVAAQALLVPGLLCLAAVAAVLLRDRVRLGAGSWLLVAAGVGMGAVTRELLPLAALLVLIGLAPLGAAELEPDELEVDELERALPTVGASGDQATASSGPTSA